MSVIQSFKDQGTDDIFNGVRTRAARKTCPEGLWRIAARKIDLLDSVVSLGELRIPPGNRLEALSGDRRGHTVSVSTIATASASFGLLSALKKLR